MAQFNDHFSTGARGYARHRPGYPRDLFVWLASIAPSLECAWDCGTGSGQAAAALAQHFQRVIATDASASQLGSAAARPGVIYRLAPSECSGLPDDSVDIVTVAQALHWFDLPAFYREASRVLKAGGVLAAWTYNLLSIDSPTDSIVNRLYSDLGAYWPRERHCVETGYQEMPFPFDEIEAPPFTMTADWTLSQLTGYLRTWSAVRRYCEHTGNDPVEDVERELADVWRHPAASRHVRWPLSLRVGRIRPL